MLFIFNRDISNLRFKVIVPETILSWSYGEICNANDYDDDGEPISEGLFCPRIFGPGKNNKCLCLVLELDGEMTCRTCGVYLGGDKTQTRSRFGHINLITPVIHTLFHRPIPSVLAMLLDIEVEVVRDIIDCKLHIVMQSNLDGYKRDQIISTEIYREMWRKGGQYSVISSGQAIAMLLSKLQLSEIRMSLAKDKRYIKSNESSEVINKRLEIIQGFSSNNIKLEWLVISVLPVCLQN